MGIKDLFSEKRKVMSQKSISDITGSETPVESSDYIDNYIARKERYMPPINFATASNFAKFGSAKEYSKTALERVYSTYPYDGSLSEKIDWLNRSNFYDLYIFNHKYPRTCGYAVFSPQGWGTRVGSEVNSFGYSDSPEYIQLKGGPHPDPNSGSLKLSRQFPTPYDGRANLYDSEGVGRESNLALDLDKGTTIEYWIKGPSSSAVVADLDSKTTNQVTFDLWNGRTGTTEGNSYGRFMVYGVGGAIRASWASGSTFFGHNLDSRVATALGDGEWHHVAITVKQVPDGTNYRVEWNDFLDGNWLSSDTSSVYGSKHGPITGSLIANIGSARIPSINQAQSAAGSVTTLIDAGTNEGYGKLSGSIDEFRYWKSARTPQQINRFWNTQIGGGTNTDNTKFTGSAQPVDLGVYYKFNEGNVGDSTVDSTVLDYSGRITNGSWVGYTVGSSRVAGETSSAMVESSASVAEFKDPIIYSSHPDVSALYTLLTEEGEEWDLQNNMALYHTMPEWITSEDQDIAGEQLKKLTQIIASYFDTIFLQIQAIPSIASNQYSYEEVILHDPNERTEVQTQELKFSNSPPPFAKRLIEDLGMDASELFAMADELALLGNRDERDEFEQKLYDIKNTIYQNIYNSLTYIYKSKGTEKSFRNLVRCFGVDDELIKINLYVDGATYSFDDSNYRSTSVKRKYIDFNDADRNQSTMFQSASAYTANSIGHIPGWNPTLVSTAGATGSAMTFEADVIFPYKFPVTHPSNLWYNYPHLTSSIFGCHEVGPYMDAPVAASCVFDGLASLNGKNGTTITFTNTDGTTHTLTTNSGLLYNFSTSPIIGTQNITSDAQATEALWKACNSSISAGQLKMSISPATLSGGETSFTLTQNVGGYSSNTVITGDCNDVHIQKKTVGGIAGGTTFSTSAGAPGAAIRFTGGRGYDKDYSQDHTGKRASITIEGLDSLDSETATTFALTGSDGVVHAIVTNGSAPYNMTAFTGGQVMFTQGISGGADATAKKQRATQAIHIGLTHAIKMGALQMTLTPETWTNETSITLTQNIPGASGNTTVVVPAGISVNGAGSGAAASFTGGESDIANFQVYALRDAEESKNVRFMLTSSNGDIPTLTSSLFYDVYDNERWFFSAKVYPESPLEGSYVSGSGAATTVSGSWTVELQGYNPLLDQLQNSFAVSASVSSEVGTYFMNANKKVYAGAHRIDFSGSLDKRTDIKIGSVRVWDDYLNDFETMVHAKDPANFGRERAYRNSYLFSSDQNPRTDVDFIPQFETLLLNWDFQSVTGSTSAAYLEDYYGGSAWQGSFEIADYSSGSDDKWEVLDRYKYHYTGRGDWFLPEDSTRLVDTNYLSSVRTNLPEVSSGEDTISILDTDDNFFTRDSKAINHYFAIEKSMYQTISEEMLKMFATTVEFNNLVGEPVNRYRQEYKSLGKLREAFFRKVGNVPDFNKFINFYKWIDGSLTDMLKELVPMSANFSDGVKNVVESHILERNKYWNKFPTLEMKASEPVGRLRGINELAYNWQYGHAPLNPTHQVNEDTNCLWWKERSEATASFVAGNQLDTDRNVLRRSMTSNVTTNKILATGEYTDPINYPNSGFPNAAEINLKDIQTGKQYKGSTYALRRFSKPYKLSSEESVQFHGGVNYHANKRRELTKHWVTTASPTGRTLTHAPGYTDDLKDCEDVLDPSEKKFHSYAIDADGGSSLGEGGFKGAHYGVFNLVSSSVATNASLAETGIDIVNLHDDSYGDRNERPMQGPFTERHVGGMAHRHQDISDTTHTNLNRTENFRITNLVKDLRFYLSPGDYVDYTTRKTDQPFDRFYRDGVAKRPVNIRNILTTTDSALSQSALGNYDNEIQILNTHNEGGTFLAKMLAATGSDGFHTLTFPTGSLAVSDTSDKPKLLAVGKTLLDSATPLVPPYANSQFNPYLSKNKITERFSAPGDPSTAGDAFGGFGIDKEANKYSVYNALPWRNRQVRFPTNALLTAHTGRYGSMSGSSLSADASATALTASFHKTHRNSDHVFKHTSGLTAFRENSVFFGGSTADQFYRDNTSVNDLRKITVSIWFYLPPGGSAQANLFGFNTQDGISVISDSYIRFRVRQASSWTWFHTPANSIQTDRWHHVVIALDQGETQEWRTISLDYATMSSGDKYFPKFWIDGKPVPVSIEQDTDWSGTANTDWGDICVGTYYKGSSTIPFAGYIQDISVWNDVLTDAQVEEIFRLPGYDSSGPGDLTRLKYVSADEDTNKLHAWWQFNHATDINDVAPIGNSLHLDGHNGSPSVNTNYFLPANYYGTQCSQRHDNYYIQHPIPANDFGYAWITASADHSVGCESLTTASFLTASEHGSAGAVGNEHTTRYMTGAINGLPPYPEETIYTDFAGLNLNVRDEITASANYLGFPLEVPFMGSSYVASAKVAGGNTVSYVPYGHPTARAPGIRFVDNSLFNHLMLHRNGPYGYPSWKQIRGGNHPIVREHKKSNILSLVLSHDVLAKTLTNEPAPFDLTGAGKYRTLTRISNLKESPVSINHPLVHRVETVSNGIAQELTIKHTYANNLTTFANPTRRRILDKTPPAEKPRQTYDDFKDMYLSGDEDADVNPVKSFKSLIYTQTIYPKLENTYLSGSRSRLAYAETSTYISESKNGEYRTFWKDNLEDRRREDGALNSMGYPIYANFNQASPIQRSNHLAMGTGSLSIWPLDVGTGTQDYLAGTAATGQPYVIGSSSVGSPAGDNVDLPVSDTYGGTWGELQRDPNASLFASLSTSKLNTLNGLGGNENHFMRDDHYKAHGTASQCLDHFDLAGLTHYRPSHMSKPTFGGYPLVAQPQYSLWGRQPSVWNTNTWAGRNPWFDSYEQYSDDIKSMGQDYSVLPEFKISDHIEYYVNQGGFKSPVKNHQFLSLPGSHFPSGSALSETGSYIKQFWKDYSHSDFMEAFEVIQEDHESVADLSVINIKCSAIKKLLPYNGFYPVQRCLQLGSLMSASYAPSLSGSSEADYGAVDTGEYGSEYRAERLQSFLQPFFAPGIMYNSIKSGLAVDYPIHTSQASVVPIVMDPSGMSVPNSYPGTVVGASSSHHVVTSDPDFRVPFEALLDPQRFIPSSHDEDTGILTSNKMYLTAPYFGSSSFYAQLNGDVTTPYYKMAINNFTAEVPNFFLKQKTLSTFRSARQEEFKDFDSGSVYYMDVIIEKTPDLLMNSHYNPVTSVSNMRINEIFNDLQTSHGYPGSEHSEVSLCSGWGFGPKYHVTGALPGGGAPLDWNGSGGSIYFNTVDPAFAVHAPPYTYGSSVARISVRPHEIVELAEGESVRLSLEQILGYARRNTHYFMQNGVGLPDALQWQPFALRRVPEENSTRRYPAKEHAMAVSSSMNLFAASVVPEVEYDASTRDPMTAHIKPSPNNKTWVMHTKWETPVFNFATTQGGGDSFINSIGIGSAPSMPVVNAPEVTGSWWRDKEFPTSLKKPLGMWKGYGEIPSDSSGIKISIRESATRRSIFSGYALTGSLIEQCGFKTETKKVGELADSKMISEAVVAIPFVDIEGERKFFALGNTISQSRDIFLKAVRGEEGPGRSIRQMANRMSNYVLPPHLDFMNDEDIEPFAMYIFEFSHKLSRQDLSNIWQNVMPDIAVTAEKATSALSHTTGENEFFRGNKIPDNTRWMVFKIKQRSATSYFKMTAGTRDDSAFQIQLNDAQRPDPRDEAYNYNWPYDFFSLVELAKVDVKAGIGDDAFPIPPAFTPTIGSTFINPTAAMSVNPMVTKPVVLNPIALGSDASALTFTEDTGVSEARSASKQRATSLMSAAPKFTSTGLLTAIKKLSGGGNR